MAEKTFKTGILITGDASGAQKAIKLTEDQLASLNRKVADSGSSFGAWTKNLGAATATAAKWAAVAAGAAIAGGAALVKNSLDAAEATGILAGKLGITTEALSKLEYAAKLSDVSQASLESGLKKLSKTLADAADPASKSARALAEIGLSAEQLLELPADQQLGAIADALSRVENQSQKAALAQKIFGRAGVDLLPLLAEGSQGLAAFGDELERLGGVVDADFAKRAAAFNDNLDRMKVGLQGVGFSVTEALMPSLETMSDRVSELASNEGAVAGLKALMSGLESILSFAAHTAIMAAEGIGMLTTEIIDLLTVTNTEKLADLNAELEELKKRRDLLGGLLAGGKERAAELADVSARIAAIEKERAALMGLVAAEEQHVESQKQQAAGAEELHEIDMRTIPARKRLSEDLAKSAAENAKKAEQARQREIEKTESLIRSLMEEQAALRMTERDQARFAAQLRLGANATEAQRLEVDRLVQANFDLQESQRAAEEAAAAQARAIKEVAEQADPWAEALTGAVERVDSAFVDLWKNIGDGFDSFADSLKESFKQLLAELAHLAITRPIVMKIGAALGLGGGSASAFAGGGGGGFNLGSIMSLGGTLKSGWAGFQAGGLSGAIDAMTGGWGGLASGMSSLYSGMGNLAGMVGLDQVQLLANAKGLALGQASFGQALTNLGGSLAAGFAGNWAGNKLGQSLFGERETTGIGGTLGGMIGSVWGPLGAGIGSFLGSLAENAIGKIFGLGDHQKWVKSGVQVGNRAITDGSNQRTEIAASGLQLTSVAKRSDPAGANMMLDAFLGLDEALTLAARANGIEIDFAGKVLGRKALDVDNQGPNDGYQTAAESADDFVRDWIAQIEDELPARVKTVLGDISKRTADEIVRTFGFATDMDRLLSIDVLKVVADTVTESQKTILDAYDAATEAVVGLAQEYDGTAESMQALTESLTNQKAVAAQLAAAYEEVSGLVEATFGGAITSIEESLLSESELYAKRRSQIAGLTDELAGTVDPARIAELVTQIDSLANSAWSLLDEGQRAALGQEFIDFLTQAQELAEEQIAEGRASLGDRETAVKGAVDLEILNTAALTQQAAADTFQGSVNQFGGIINGLNLNLDAIREYLAAQGYEVNA